MNALKLYIDNEPIANMRHRARNIRGQMWMYDPQEQQKKKTQFIIRSQMTGNGVYFDSNETLGVRIRFVMDKPKKLSRSEICEFSWKLRDAIKKPDIDNLSKYYLDVMKGIVYPDDCQIVESICRKEYVSWQFPNPGTHIFVYPIRSRFMPFEEVVKKCFTFEDLKIFDQYIQDYLSAENPHEVLVRMSEFCRNFADLRKRVDKM